MLTKMADGVDIDLYAEDLEPDFNQVCRSETPDSNDDPDYNHDAGVDLYDDVITAPSSDDNPSDDYNVHHDAPKMSSSSPSSAPSVHSGRRVALYVGNLTWWTTDQDITDAIHSVGVSDLVEIKFYENRANGQSKGFCVLTLGSEQSSRMVMDKLPKKELHGQTPMVTHCNRQALNQFEMQSRKPGQSSCEFFNENSFEFASYENVSRQSGRRSSNMNRNQQMGMGPPRGMQQNNQRSGRVLPGQYSAPLRPPGGPMGPPPSQGPPAPYPPDYNQMPPGMRPNGPPMSGPQGPPMQRPGPPPGPGGPPPPPGMPGPLPPRPGGPMPPGMPPPMGSGPPLGPRGPPPPDPRGPPPRPDWNRPPGKSDRFYSLPMASGPPVDSYWSSPPPRDRLPRPHWSKPKGYPPQQPPPIGPPPGQGLPPSGRPPVPGPGGPPPSHLPPPGQGPAPHVNPAFFPPQQGQPLSAGPPPNSQPGDMYSRPPPPQYGDYRPPDGRGLPPGYGDYRPPTDGRPEPPMNEAEFEEIMTRNRTVSSSAIARSVADASAGEYGSAIETLVTAISLIKQSKVANDERCKILISSLQDTLHGIESKSYGSRSKDRGRSRERERSRERDRSSHREKGRGRRDRSRSREREYRERSRERDRYHDERYREKERDRDREREREHRSSRH